jgi:hypothetical protein
VKIARAGLVQRSKVSVMCELILGFEKKLCGTSEIVIFETFVRPAEREPVIIEQNGSSLLSLRQKPESSALFDSSPHRQ